MQGHRRAIFARRLILAIGIAMTIIATALFYLWRYEPDRRLYPIRGIDVSHHQGRIDWRQVAAEDVAFAYLKASEGGDYTDPSFDENRLAAQAAGLRIGAYHFFTLCRAGIDQARHFLAVLGADGALDLTPVVDLEFGGNCTAKPTAAALKAELDGFIAAVEQAGARPVTLYMTDEFRAAYGAILPDRPVWVRSLFHQPAIGGWSLWQYHNAGSVKGITGRVDLNVYCGDRAQWHKAVGTTCPGFTGK